MSLFEIFSTYNKLSKYKFESEDDDHFVEKIFRKFSAIMMIVFTVLLGFYQIVGRPINCWCNNEHDVGKRCDYAKTYCYITATYVPVSNQSGQVLPNRNELQSHGIMYYQWVPYIFLIQSLMFYFPHIVWKYFSAKSGFDVKNYIKSLRSDDSDLKNSQAVKYVVSHIKSCLDYHRSYKSRGLLSCLRVSVFHSGTYLTVCYLWCKLLYLFLTLAQLYLLNYWLKDSFNSSASVWQVLFGAHNFRWSERFPRMTLCKFSVYILTDQQPHWVQCALPINIYIEKMYMLVWAWLWILVVIISADIIHFVFKSFRSTQFIRERMLDIDAKNEKLLADDLTKDGLLMLHLVKSNTNEFYVNAILSNLVDIYCSSKD